MMGHLNMKLSYKSISQLVILSSVIACNATADTMIAGTIEGKTIKWTDGEEKNDYVISEGNEPMGHIEYATEWKAGVKSYPSQIILKHTGTSDSVYLTIDEVGGSFTYSYSPASVQNNPDARSCAYSESSGLAYEVISSNGVSRCYGEDKISLSSSMQPFSYIKPIVSFSNIIGAFNDKPAGVYVGYIPISYTYGFNNNSDPTGYRDIAIMQKVVISNMPNFIQSIDLSAATLDLTPQTDGSGSIFAEETLTVTANGNMGPKLSLYVPQVMFNLVSGKNLIPLDVELSSNNKTQIIASDAVRQARTFDIETQVNHSSHSFDLIFRYSEDSIEDGVYSNSFYFLVEMPLQ
ncbi:hypothetical protein A140_18880 [Vibrio crassostreae 9ZC88]|nr:hypothetical protein A140_18880 [Vibrio crassostreae 9ZC88]